MSWDKEKQDLGRIPAKQPVTIKFKYLNKDGSYYTASASCGCTLPKWDIANNELVAVYTPKAVPFHLKKEGKTEYNSTKYISATMMENGEQKKYTLTIEAKVYES